MEKLKKLIQAFIKLDIIKNLIRDLKSLRALWCWIYMTVDVWTRIYVLLKFPEHIPPLLMYSTTLVSVIFSGYVISRSYEKKNGVSPPNSGGEAGGDESALW